MTSNADGIACRKAHVEDIESILSLLPRLADFDVPEHRRAEDLWRGDAALMRAWADGRRDDLAVVVATDGAGVVGVAAASERPELLSGVPSAHLEALAVDVRGERRGIGRRLLAEIESIVRKRGARGMSLHVFASNDRARALYARAGFDEEIVRGFKPFE